MHALLPRLGRFIGSESDVPYVSGQAESEASVFRFFFLFSGAGLLSAEVDLSCAGLRGAALSDCAAPSPALHTDRRPRCQPCIGRVLHRNR